MSKQTSTEIHINIREKIDEGLLQLGLQSEVVGKIQVILQESIALLDDIRILPHHQSRGYGLVSILLVLSGLKRMSYSKVVWIASSNEGKLENLRKLYEGLGATYLGESKGEWTPLLFTDPYINYEYVFEK